MSERESDQAPTHDDTENEPLLNPGPGSPVGETLAEGSEPGQLEDTPRISGDDQTRGQTQHPAPADEVGVPEDVGD